MIEATLKSSAINASSLRSTQKKFPRKARRIAGKFSPMAAVTQPASDAISYAREVVSLGAGEILLTSMDRDGTKQGYDIALTRARLQHDIDGTRHCVGWRWQSRTHGGGNPRRRRNRRFGGLHFPLRRAQRARGQGLHGQGRPADAARSLTATVLFSRRRGSHEQVHAGGSGKASARARKGERGGKSYTRTLIDEGVAHCAKKLGEEAIETVLPPPGGQRTAGRGSGRSSLSSAGIARSARRLVGRRRNSAGETYGANWS